MNKKNFLKTSLASVAVLGAVFFASQTSVVKAESQNGPVATQPEKPAYGVNGPALVQPEQPSYGENGPVVTQPEQPAYDDSKDSTVLDKPDFNGGVNAADAPVLDKPEYPLNKKAPAAPANVADKAADKAAAKDGDLKVLPKTGTKENAALASAGFLGLALTGLSFAKRKN